MFSYSYTIYIYVCILYITYYCVDMNRIDEIFVIIDIYMYSTHFFNIFSKKITKLFYENLIRTVLFFYTRFFTTQSIYEQHMIYDTFVHIFLIASIIRVYIYIYLPAARARDDNVYQPFLRNNTSGNICINASLSK